MAAGPTKKAPKTECSDCWIRKLKTFRNFTSPELQFVSSFKTGQLGVDAGATILVEGSHSAHLYTVLDGWGFRHKILEDGRRQILNYVLPGDLIGLQGTLMGEMQHSVEALSAMQLCVFEREKINALFEGHPSLAFDVTWIAAQEERMLDEHLLSVGRRSALERAAYLMAFLSFRGREAGLLNGGPPILPVTQQHVADTLGLSIVHTNKTLRKLADRHFIRWLERGCEVLDEAALCQIAGWKPSKLRPRPFI